jgi:hypothetical protein
VGEKMTLLLRFLPFMSKVSSIQWMAIIAAIAFSIGALGAYKVTSWYYDASYAKALEQALIDQQIEIGENKVIEEKIIYKKGKERIIYKTNIQKVIEYVKRNDDTQCLDAGGLQRYREALAGSSTSLANGKVPQ